MMAKTKAEIQRDYEKRSHGASKSKYDKANTKMYGVKVVIPTERDIYEKLESTPNKSGYIKNLIKNDLENNSK